MRKFITLSALLFLACFSVSSFAQDENNQEEMMKAWQEYMTPGPMHELLAKGTGEWSADIKSWMDPGQPATETTGTAEIKSILGGRYFEGHYTGEFGGMPMDGMDITGYDNAKQKFLNTWIDNFGTGIMYMEGTYDEPAKTFTYTGTSIDPLSKKDVSVRQTIQLIDNDHHHMEMFMTDKGHEFKTMEIDFTRKK
jgi:hypothetical protein